MDDKLLREPRRSPQVNHMNNGWQQYVSLAYTVRAAVLAERERCAKIAESHDGDWGIFCGAIAEHIREEPSAVKVDGMMTPRPYDGKPLDDGEVIARCWSSSSASQLIAEDRVLRASDIEEARKDQRWIMVDLPGNKDPRGRKWGFA